MKALGPAFIAIALICPAQNSTCTASDGRGIEIGLLRYGTNSDREAVVKIESDEKYHRCKAVWIAGTEIHTTGTPYDFHLVRVSTKARRLDAREFRPADFVKRDKTYQFVFGADSASIREMRPTASAGVVTDQESQSNRTLWDSILSGLSPDRKQPQKDSPSIDPTRELNRTSWVLARRDIRAHFVGRLKDAGQNEKLVALSKTRIIQAGQLGQIEAVKDGYALVRFYEGSRVESFGAKKNLFRRWYANTGGPYMEAKDDLYTAVRAEIVEVSIDDIVEVNDYLDQRQTNRT